MGFHARPVYQQSNSLLMHLNWHGRLARSICVPALTIFQHLGFVPIAIETKAGREEYIDLAA